MSKKERRLSNEQRKCNICGGGLRELSDEEKRVIKTSFGTGFDFPRGIYVCEKCNEVATIGLTTIDMENEDWFEVVETLNKNKFLSERQSIDRIFETVSSLPEQHATVVSLGHLFKCEGAGVGCSLYKMASFGWGAKGFCPSCWCNYDPYPQEYKKLFWYKTESSWPKKQTNVIDCWFDVITNKNNNVEVRIDAINRVGTMVIQSVSRQLCSLFSMSGETKIKEAILMALNKQKTTTEIEQILRQGLGYDSPVSTQLLLLKQLRTRYHQYDIIVLAKNISYLTTSQNEKVANEAKKTLYLLKKQANKEKPDIKLLVASAKD